MGTRLVLPERARGNELTTKGTKGTKFETRQSRS